MNVGWFNSLHFIEIEVSELFVANSVYKFIFER